MTIKDKKEYQATFRDVMRFAVHYWRPQKWKGITAAVLMLCAVSTDAAVPVYTGKIVDAMTQHAAGDVQAAHAAWMAFAVFCLLALAHQALRGGAMVSWNRFAVLNLYGIVTEGLEKVQRFSSDWHANTFGGGTVRKITRGMWAFDQFEDTLLMGLLPAVTIMIAVTVMFALKLAAVGVLTAVLILLYCGISIWISVKVLQPRFVDSAAQDTKVGAVLADIVTGNPTVKAFGTEQREDAVFKSVADVWRRKALHAWQTAQAADCFRGVFRAFMTGSVVAMTIFLWMGGKASPGDIVLVITTFFIIGGYLRDVGMHISHLQRAISDMEDAIYFWHREDDIADVPEARTLSLTRDGSGQKPMISFDRVSFQYPNTGKTIYEDLSVDIAAGEKLALVGPSGSGKSTFVKLVQRLYNLHGGSIRIDGQDIAQVTLESLRRHVALVPQDPILFHRSLSENIAYGCMDATQEEIIAAAKKAFAHDFIMTLPQGYDTLVGERGVKLSGGERQRVAIARAILADTPILVLDEATSSLDSISEHYIQKALQTLMAGRTTITIAHRLSTIRQADRILVFDRGRIIEQGSHDSLIAQPESRYKALYDMQALDLVAEYGADSSADAAVQARKKEA